MMRKTLLYRARKANDMTAFTVLMFGLIIHFLKCFSICGKDFVNFLDVVLSPIPKSSANSANNRPVHIFFNVKNMSTLSNLQYLFNK